MCEIQSQEVRNKVVVPIDQPLSTGMLESHCLCVLGLKVAAVGEGDVPVCKHKTIDELHKSATSCSFSKGKKLTQ